MYLFMYIYMHVYGGMVCSGALVQHMERRYQALAPDLSRTGREHQAPGINCSGTAADFPKPYTLNKGCTHE